MATDRFTYQFLLILINIQIKLYNNNGYASYKRVRVSSFNLINSIVKLF